MVRQDPFEFVFLLSGLTGAMLLVALAITFYFIYRFITMNTTPFKAMKAIYVYIAALIGLALVAFGLYGIIEHLLGILLAPATEFAQNGVTLNTALLITPLTQIIVGLFIMVPHWAIGHHFNLKESRR